MPRDENSAKEKTRRPSKKQLYGIALVIIVVSVSFVCWYSTTNKTSLKAAIVDSGALTVGVTLFFTDNVTKTLKEAGYTVDYIAPENVTVEFYRNLPTLGYSIIILRVQISTPNIYSGEIYDEWKYVEEQSAGEIVEGFWWGNQSYFAITPLFVKNLRESFRNVTIINMGCNTLANASMPMAKAFIEKGVKAYIGWKSSQSIQAADNSTEILLKHLITERKTIEQAVNETMEEKNTYPILSYYPPEAGAMGVKPTSNISLEITDYLMMLLQILIPVDIVGGIAVIVDVISRRRRKRKKLTRNTNSK